MKKGKAVAKWSLLAMSLTCILTSSFLLFTPAIEAEGQVTARCAGGSEVICDGFQCTATDNVGCSCRDSSGAVVDKKNCPKTEELLD